MTLVDVGPIIVSIIALIGAWLSQRSAQRAAERTSRWDAEAEAYERARDFDVSTIKRQDAELAEIRDEFSLLKAKYKMLLGQLEEENVLLKEELETRILEVERLREELRLCKEEREHHDFQ